METIVQIHGKQCRIKLSKTAKNALAVRELPLVVEMEITLACMIRKIVRFHEDTSHSDTITVNDTLCLRLVSGEHCGVNEKSRASQTTGIAPIINWKAVVPHWLEIDYQHGDWVGQFGYGRF